MDADTAERFLHLVLQFLSLINTVGILTDHWKLLCRSIIVLGKDINVNEHLVDWFGVPIDFRLTGNQLSFFLI